MLSFLTLLNSWRDAVAGTDEAQPPVYKGKDVIVTQITDDTRHMQPDACFVVRVRVRGDGTVWSDAHPYVATAIAQGARVIIGQRPAAELDVTIPEDIVYLTVPDTAQALAWLAAAWHGFPSHELVTIGITGTDGKSSTAQILHTLLRQAGIAAGMLSTIKAVIGDQEEPLDLHVTTPEAPTIQRYLRRMVSAGMTHVVLETTSHSLAQHRVTAVAYDVAVVTNITHEHLDYHGSWDAYFAAKQRLFTITAGRRWRVISPNPFKYAQARTLVLNRDDASYDRLQSFDASHIIGYGMQQPAEIRATDLTITPAQTRFMLHAGGDTAVIQSALVGEFNVYNMLAAAGTAVALHLPLDAIKAGLEAVTAIKGRMQRVDRGQPFSVIVDFAHTPISLEKAIGVAGEMTNGRVITVFGSAGQRDVAKRTLMATAAAQHADLTVLTAEDPRTESLAEILATMADACRHQGGVEGQTFWRIPDRGQAIYFAFTLAQPGDLVLICGKGHEQSICFGRTEYPWDDVQVTETALDAFLQGKPMPDTGLPTFDKTFNISVLG